jgi:BirA family biotin operon repressor/biotin-[acetyl-CoA-carboxylase] ligase
MREKIIHFLKKNDSYLSGEEISRDLRISRAAIWKYIQDLRSEGYDIVAVPHLGYKLLSVPDKLFPEEIQHDLKTRVIGKKVVYEETVSSTMDIAFRLGMEGAPEGTVICAESQTRGRGRLGRNWSSPKGKGIYFSVILRPACAPVEVAKLTLLTAVAVCEAIEKETGVSSRIKWPNDLLVKGKKIAGILTELNAEMDKVKFVVVGIGINVNATANMLPEGATSLKQETGESFLRVALMQAVLRQLEQWYLPFKDGDFLAVIKRWRELSVTLGRRVRITDPAGKIEGEAIDIDSDGGLLIRQDSGIITKRMAGDVVLAH